MYKNMVGNINPFSGLFNKKPINTTTTRQPSGNSDPRIKKKDDFTVSILSDDRSTGRKNKDSTSDSFSDFLDVKVNDLGSKKTTPKVDIDPKLKAAKLRAKEARDNYKKSQDPKFQNGPFGASGFSNNSSVTDQLNQSLYVKAGVTKSIVTPTGEQGLKNNYIDNQAYMATDLGRTNNDFANVFNNNAAKVNPNIRNTNSKYNLGSHASPFNSAGQINARVPSDNITLGIIS